MSMPGGAASGHRALAHACRMPEAEAVGALCRGIAIGARENAAIEARALELARGIRAAQRERIGAEAFLRHYGLSTREGVVLMCLAEALLRIPDPRTADELILDKLAEADFTGALGDDDSLLLNASTWALMLTGRLVAWRADPGDEPAALVKRTLSRLGAPVARTAIGQAMRIMASQFVMGETIEAALAGAREAEAAGYRHSYDMLGEAALTGADAERYAEAYRNAIAALAADRRGRSLADAPGISVKLSALHPRYEIAQRGRVMRELVPRVAALAAAAADAGIMLTIDAEESERLLLSLDVFAGLARDPRLDGWNGLGLALQAYQKRAIHVLGWLIELARATGRRLPVRLVKGAYWDGEIKKAQQAGLAFPVFTRKAATDVSYIACAQRMLAARTEIYPQFATHNPRTVATVLVLARDERDFEFQKLHGMGDALYPQLAGAAACRVYAPVGSYRELLPYLVRRLLENGANSSFVHQIGDPDLPLAALVADPIAAVTAAQYQPHPRIRAAAELFDDRRNSAGIDLADAAVLGGIAQAVSADRQASGAASPGARIIAEPMNRDAIVGTTVDSDAAAVEHAITAAAAAAPAWNATAAGERARCLERAADLLESRSLELMTLLIREGGKTIDDAHAEVREAVDFCRYYAAGARRLFAPRALPGPTGELDELTLHGRGVFACVSPWNFPLAIFTGQVAAALAAGNAVVAKPAEQTPLVAARAVALLHAAGVPREALQLVQGPGETVGSLIVDDARVSGVAFTGSFATAQLINRRLAARAGPIVPFIAETGGQNAMIVDSSALPEQVVSDVIASAFRSAGQRCSALRVLFLQEEVAARVIDMLAGAMRELKVGDPADPATDVGPVIDAAARQALSAHLAWLRTSAQAIAEVELPAGLERGTFFAPVAFEIGIGEIPRQEVFGPVLHVVRYRADALEAVLAAIDATGCGLTLGIASRIERFAEAIRAHARIGNTYVNRNMIGAVVGVQPFGGEGLSGTGPKAGGPNYLARFAVERTFTVNTAAAGGNASLLAESD
ncbi:MAG TPA: bifunctional proline dehydrogenase/L-glutamate gamma-semialdehyde dehydrogenase PutA [Burkholderiales bacterium]|nr:bifunctional proline dehydrogenase/L-glutamate gamma-semialdehyde dehydrogenase PutA [Burkholderiales bacterium]